MEVSHHDGQSVASNRSSRVEASEKPKPNRPIKQPNVWGSRFYGADHDMGPHMLSNSLELSRLRQGLEAGGQEELPRKEREGRRIKKTSR